MIDSCYYYINNDDDDGGGDDGGGPGVFLRSAANVFCFCQTR